MECPKCQHVRIASDAGPSYECPQCGIVYAKFDPAVEERDAALRVKLAGRIQRQPIETPVKATIESVNEAKLSELVDEPQSNSFAGNTAVCKNCEEIGQVTDKLPGSGWVEFAMFCLFFFPGVIYSVWRRKGIKQVCAACGSDQLVAAKTRAGKQIIENQYGTFTICRDSEPAAFAPPKFGKLTAICVGLFTVSLVFIGGNSIFIGIRDSDSQQMWIIGLMFLAVALGTGRLAKNYWNNKPIAIKSVKVGQGLVGH